MIHSNAIPFDTLRLRVRNGIKEKTSINISGSKIDMKTFLHSSTMNAYLQYVWAQKNSNSDTWTPSPELLKPLLYKSHRPNNRANIYKWTPERDCSDNR